jgi:hypothetical protein
MLLFLPKQRYGSPPNIPLRSRYPIEQLEHEDTGLAARNWCLNIMEVNEIISSYEISERLTRGRNMDVLVTPNHSELRLIYVKHCVREKARAYVGRLIISVLKTDVFLTKHPSGERIVGHCNDEPSTCQWRF